MERFHFLKLETNQTGYCTFFNLYFDTVWNSLAIGEINNHAVTPRHGFLVVDKK